MASSVNLGSNLDGVVDQLVSGGRYGSRSEVLRAGVRLVQEREAQFARLEAEIRKGIIAAEAGDSQPAEQVRSELLARYEAMHQKNVA